MRYLWLAVLLAGCGAMPMQMAPYSAVASGQAHPQVYYPYYPAPAPSYDPFAARRPITCLNLGQGIIQCH